MFQHHQLMRLAWLAIGFVAACTKQNEHVCVNGNCPSSDFPFCDVGGEVGGFPGLCVAVDCTPGEFAACRSDGAITCNARGDDYDVVPCEHGCTEASAGCTACVPSTVTCDGNNLVTCDADGNATVETCRAGCVDGGSPRCAYLEPRYLPDICDTPAVVEELVFSKPLGGFSSSDDFVCNGGIIKQSAGSATVPEICVLRYKRIAIRNGGSVRVTIGSGGTVGRAVAFVADESVSIESNAFLDIGASSNTSGPGGGYTFSGPGSATIAPDGAGGAGFKTAGAAGGTSAADGGANDAGPAAVDPAQIDVLVGGPRTTLAGGGGAATLIACRGTVTVDGVITAGGGGAQSGQVLLGTLIGGGGGGAGGYVVIQGLGVEIRGGLYANGGGGGAGKPSNLSVGSNGLDGTSSLTSAAGGTGQSGAGSGGAGATGTTTPRPGARSTLSGATPGGGGGSVGFLQTYTPAGIAPVLTPSEASPAFSANRNVPTR